MLRANHLLFLCGANRADGRVSARREAIKKFIEDKHPACRVIYAEAVFDELLKLGHKSNILDLEHEVSDIADKILIVLESESAFCELGAFSHKSFREKLIVFNDKKFHGKNSFINAGPIAAAEEKKAPILWYPMGSGVETLDGVGATFKRLKDVINAIPSKGLTPVDGDLSNLAPTKESLFFAHDLVLFFGPISYSELIDVLIEAFGKKNYEMLRRLLGVLYAADLIKICESDGKRFYSSRLKVPFVMV